MHITENSLLTKEVFRQRGVVILPLREYDKIKRKMDDLEKERKLSVQEEEALEIIAEGEREYKEGRLKPIKSLAELD